MKIRPILIDRNSLMILNYAKEVQKLLSEQQHKDKKRLFGAWNSDELVSYCNQQSYVQYKVHCRRIYLKRLQNALKKKNVDACFYWVDKIESSRFAEECSFVNNFLMNEVESVHK